MRLLLPEDPDAGCVGLCGEAGGRGRGQAAETPRRQSGAGGRAKALERVPGAAQSGSARSSLCDLWQANS